MVTLLVLPFISSVELYVKARHFFSIIPEHKSHHDLTMKQFTLAYLKYRKSITDLMIKKLNVGLFVSLFCDFAPAAMRHNVAVVVFMDSASVLASARR